MTPSATSVNMSIASLPSRTSVPPAKGTECRHTPPDVATNATHRVPVMSVCTATREENMDAGDGSTRSK